MFFCWWIKKSVFQHNIPHLILRCWINRPMSSFRTFSNTWQPMTVELYMKIYLFLQGRPTNFIPSPTTVTTSIPPDSEEAALFLRPNLQNVQTQYAPELSEHEVNILIASSYLWVDFLKTYSTKILFIIWAKKYICSIILNLWSSKTYFRNWKFSIF